MSEIQGRLRLQNNRGEEKIRLKDGTIAIRVIHGTWRGANNIQYWIQWGHKVPVRKLEPPLEHGRADWPIGWEEV